MSLKEIEGYVLAGHPKLHLEGQIIHLVIHLELDDCWVVPPHARHTYEILEPFRAVEATAPPA